MEPIERVETVEADNNRYISLEFSRPWPKYEVRWSVRRRIGESDFPVANGAISAPLAQGQSVDALWDELREKAMAAAVEAQGAEGPVVESKGSSFLGRLFGRR